VDHVAQTAEKKIANTYFVGKTEFKIQLTIPRSRSLRGKNVCLPNMVREWAGFARLLVGESSGVKNVR